MKNRIAIAVVMMLALGALYGCDKGNDGTGSGGSQATNTPTNSGSTATGGAATGGSTAIPSGGWGDAPDIGYTTMDGQESKLSDHLGQPLVVNFWAAWCPPCKKEMPEFEEIFKKYQGQFDLVAIAVDNRNDPMSFFAAQGFTYVGARGGQDVSKYLTSVIPVTVFIDRQGNLVHKQEGGISGEVFEGHLKKIL